MCVSVCPPRAHWRKLVKYNHAAGVQSGRTMMLAGARADPSAQKQPVLRPSVRLWLMADIVLSKDQVGIRGVEARLK